MIEYQRPIHTALSSNEKKENLSLIQNTKTQEVFEYWKKSILENIGQPNRYIKD
jgi:hypothetical protein